MTTVEPQADLSTRDHRGSRNDPWSEPWSI